MRAKLTNEDYDRLSVRAELQAVYLAGVCMHYMQRFPNSVDEREVKEMFKAVEVMSRGREQDGGNDVSVPDSLVDGTFDQRVRWFMYGLRKGDPLLMDRVFEVIDSTGGPPVDGTGDISEDIPF